MPPALPESQKKTALVRLGLEALIARESSRRLAGINGTEKGLKALPRRRSAIKKLPSITPGNMLLEELPRPMKILRIQLAKDINVPANSVSQIIHGKKEITADTALRLRKYFGIAPEFWLNLHVRYNMKIARSETLFPQTEALYLATA